MKIISLQRFYHPFWVLSPNFYHDLEKKREKIWKCKIFFLTLSSQSIAFNGCTSQHGEEKGIHIRHRP